MLNVLIGAVVGGVLNVVGYAVVQTLRGEPLDWKSATASFVGGAVGGALCGLTLGASLLAEGGVGAVAFLSVDGAAAWSSERVAWNALEGRPLGENVAHDALVGAIEAPVFYGVTRGVTRLVTPRAARVPALALGEARVSFGDRVARTLARARAAHATRVSLGTAFSNATSTWSADVLENTICYTLPESKAGGDDRADEAEAEAARPRTRGLTSVLAGAR